MTAWTVATATTSPWSSPTARETALPLLSSPMAGPATASRLLTPRPPPTSSSPRLTTTNSPPPIITSSLPTSWLSFPSSTSPCPPPLWCPRSPATTPVQHPAKHRDEPDSQNPRTYLYRNLSQSTDGLIKHREVGPNLKLRGRRVGQSLTELLTIAGT